MTVSGPSLATVIPSSEVPSATALFTAPQAFAPYLVQLPPQEPQVSFAHEPVDVAAGHGLPLHRHRAEHHDGDVWVEPFEPTRELDALLARHPVVDNSQIRLDLDGQTRRVGPVGRPPHDLPRRRLDDSLEQVEHVGLV